MKDEDLLKLRIDIRAKNNLFFQEIALLLDKPEFLQMLPALRKGLGVSELVSLDKFIDEAYDKPFKSKKRGKINFSKYKDVVKLKKFAQDFNTIYASGGIDKEMDMFQLIATEVNLTCVNLNRPPYFAEVIRQAIFCGVASDEYFHPTTVEVLESSNILPDAGFFRLPQLAIFVSPTSTYEDVKSALREAYGYFNTDKRLTYYQIRMDTVPNIRKYHHWYWERLKGKKYQQIADEWFEKHETEAVTDIDVIKGVKTYKKLLSK
jgi:hypothetical protein